MAVILLIILHTLLKLYMFSVLSVTMRAPVSVISFGHSVFFIFPFTVLPLIGAYSSFVALIILIMIEWTMILGLLPSSRKKYTYEPSINIKYARIILSLGGAMYVAAIAQQNLNLVLNFSLSNLLATANANSIARYNSELSISQFYKLAVLIAFSTATFGGYYIAATTGFKNKLFGILPILAGLIDAMFMGARSGFMLLVFVFLASYYVASLRAGKTKGLTYKRALPWVAKRIGLIFIFFLCIQLLRGGNLNTDIPRVASSILTWFVGHTSAFSIWVDSHEPINTTFGERTFSGISDIIGLSTRVGGTYQMVEFSEGRRSNVFTAYRGVFEDFSWIGGFIFIFLISLTLAGSISNNPKSTVTFVVSVILITFFSWSFVISVWKYNSVIVGQIIGGVLIVICRRKISSD